MKKSDLILYHHNIFPFLLPLSLDQIRFFNCCLIDEYQKTEFLGDTFYKVNLDLYAEWGGVALKTALAETVSIANYFRDTGVEFTMPDGKILRTSLITSTLVDKVALTLAIKWDSSFIKLISGHMTGGTFTYIEGSISGSNSTTRIHLYNQLQKWAWKSKEGWIELDYLELRKNIGLTNQYPKFAHFELKVLKPALKDIKHRLGYVISYEVNYRCRKPTSIVFKLETGVEVATVLSPEPDPLLQLTKLQELGQAKSSSKTGSTRSYSKRLG